MGIVTAMAGVIGKVAIVTAASRGIGRAVALTLGRRGASVVVNYHGNAGKAQEVVEAIEASGGAAVAVQGSVARRDDVVRLFDAADEAFGGVDIVVNVAGDFIEKPVAEITDDDVDRVLAINLRGALYVLSEAARRVREGGRILHTSSGATEAPHAGGGLYAASKAAAERIAFALAKELGPRRITVNVVSPGVTQTDGLVASDALRERLIAETPLARLGQPQEVAEAFAFLASDEGGWVNGQLIRVNGGVL
ncbi:3-oxoacyl-[acyl-carrier-protein] reductase FabG [Mycolicibacterium chlorophenolicum]|uniref:3-oxoacyl-[acyl-carrier-protein] reductase FabG n=2 Tax=Mycolicibacterium chlorophenolicum TaxID=37916 RepID=A0A0J6W563_9MYCO|nr:3-oxoacyl-[acyl-carrier-protein] reductase FabG [Mycolicibacterium chlorophenolicum]